MTNPVEDIKSNIDKRIVYSTIAASLAMGIIGVIAVKMGIKPINDVVSKAK